jgi:hypothetical protein
MFIFIPIPRSRQPVRREVLGEVGDWCDECRRLRAFTVVTLRTPITGALVATFCECWECATAFQCTEDDYDDFLDEEEVEEMSTARLLALTNQELKAEWDAWRRGQARPRSADVPTGRTVDPDED